MKMILCGSPSSIPSTTLAQRRLQPLRVLVRILADSNDIIERGIAASVLGSIGPTAEEAVPQLLKCLQEPGDSAARIYFRLKVADALWRISGEAEHLLAIASKAITSPEWWLRWQGAGLLGELGSAGSEAIPQLRSLLEDDDTSLCVVRQPSR